MISSSAVRFHVVFCFVAPLSSSGNFAGVLTGIKSKLAADVRGDLNEYHDKASLIFHSNLILSRIYLLFLYLGDPRCFFCGCSVP